MIVPGIVEQHYNYNLVYLKRVADIVRAQILEFCQENNFAFLGRIKTKESVAEKIETGRYKSWVELDDLYGCTVVIPTLVDEKGVLEFLRLTYEEVKTRLRGSSRMDPAIFRFDATRFIGKLKPGPDITGDSELLRINFEVQIRTAFEHAWSVTTHALAYKTNQVNWKTLRLAAQLKASVEQLDGLILGFESMASVVTEHLWPEVEAKRLIEQKFKTMIILGKIPPELLPSSWGRFCDNVLTLFKEMSHDRSKLVRDTTAFLNLIASKLEKVPNHIH